VSGSIKNVFELEAIACNNPEKFVEELIAELELDVTIYPGALETDHPNANAAVAIVSLLNSNLVERVAAAERVVARLSAES